METERVAHRVNGYVKDWIREGVTLLKNPHEEMNLLPTEGTFEKPLAYAAFAGAGVGVIQFLSMARWSISIAMSALISMPIMAPIGMLVGAFILNLILSALGKEPGYYRTVSLASRLSVLAPVSAVASAIHPMLGMLTSALCLYTIYSYARVIGEVEKKKAIGLVAGIAAVPLLSMLGLLGAIRIGSRYGF